EYSDHESRDGAFAEELARHEQSDRTVLDPHEDGRDHQAQRDETADRWVTPARALLVGESDEDRDERRDEDGRTEIVDTRRLRARATSGQRAPDDGEDDGADGQIHEDHQLPADGGGAD